jgi:hypothetical protein
MAANFESLSGEHTVELLGLTDVQDVYQVTARSIPSNVVYHVRFPPVIQDPESISVILSEWATQYNALASLPGVVGVGTFQDVDASGQINDVTQITVRSDDGRFTQQIEDPNFGSVDDRVRAEVAAAVAQANALAAM